MPAGDSSVDSNAVEKGFYISFDSDTGPKRPKPPLRMKRSSPKKVCCLNVLYVCWLFGVLPIAVWLLSSSTLIL